MTVSTFVNLQEFLVGMKFVVKEVAIFTCSIPYNLLTRSNKSCASWLIANDHGLRWEDENLSYNMAKCLIISTVLGSEEDDEMSTLVYFKRCQKREWLVDLLENYARENLIIETLDADYEDIDSLNNLNANTIRCGKHVKNCIIPHSNWLSLPSPKFQSINLPSHYTFKNKCILRFI
ncbi:hypothetical protein ACFW04_014527 [Cataglyphis niger]